MPRRLTPEDLALTAAEKRAAEVQAEGGAGNRAIGGTIGSLAGAGLGALGFLGGPGLGAATLGLGSSIGGALGGMAGDALSEDELGAADATLAEGEMRRQEKLARYKLRQDALNALMSED